MYLCKMWCYGQLRQLVNNAKLFVLGVAKGSIKFQIITKLTTLLSINLGVRENYQGSAGRPYMFVSHSPDTMLIDCDVIDVVVLNNCLLYLTTWWSYTLPKMRLY